MNVHATIHWPRKYELLGIGVTATSYEEVCDVVLAAAHLHQSAVVTLHAVHALVTAAGDPHLCQAVNGFDLVAADGQPVRWALNWLYRTRLRDRVYGPELTLRLCQSAASQGVPVYFYGSTAEVLARLVANFSERYPRLVLAGCESPPFRTLTSAEEDETAKRINRSGAGIVFIGLGAPKQDEFAHRMKGRIHAVQVCVGAAFDFHAGTKRMAPGWMQRAGLEWLFRLSQEPGRLWQRYLLTNSLFVLGVIRQFVGGRRATIDMPLVNNTSADQLTS